MSKKSKGFIKLDRSIFEHWIFQDAEKFKAFVDLIQLARWKDEKLLIGNDLITIPRGSYYTSELKLADRWGWGRDKTRNFLKLLESEEMINRKGTTKGTTLSIENYEFYQDESLARNTSKKHQTNNEQTSNQQRTNNEQTTNQQRTNNEQTTNQQRTNNEQDTKEEVKEIIRTSKKGEEGEEVQAPLPFPSPFHEVLFNNFGDVGYKTWFSKADIKEDTELITITVAEGFIKKVIQDRYLDQIGLLTVKKISVEVGT